MKLTVFATILFVSLGAHADDKRIVPTDALGRSQHHKPRFEVSKDGEIVEKDAFGNTLSGRPRYKVKDGDVYETDALGHVKRQVGKVEE